MFGSKILTSGANLLLLSLRIEDKALLSRYFKVYLDLLEPIRSPSCQGEYIIIITESFRFENEDDHEIWLNPLSPNSDQNQFSPNNIHTLSRDKLCELIEW